MHFVLAMIDSFSCLLVTVSSLCTLLIIYCNCAFAFSDSYLDFLSCTETESREWTRPFGIGIVSMKESLGDSMSEDSINNDESYNYYTQVLCKSLFRVRKVLIFFVLWNFDKREVCRCSFSVLLILIEEIEQCFLFIFNSIFKKSAQHKEINYKADPVSYENHWSQREQEVPQISRVPHVFVYSMRYQFVVGSFVVLDKVGEIAFGGVEG